MAIFLTSCHYCSPSSSYFVSSSTSSLVILMHCSSSLLPTPPFPPGAPFPLSLFFAFTANFHGNKIQLLPLVRTLDWTCPSSATNGNLRSRLLWLLLHSETDSLDLLLFCFHLCHALHKLILVLTDVCLLASRLPHPHPWTVPSPAQNTRPRGASNASTGDAPQEIVNIWSRLNAADMHGHWAFAGRPTVVGSEEEQPVRSPKGEKNGAVPVSASRKRPSR